MNIEKRITKNKLTSESEYRKTTNEKQTNLLFLFQSNKNLQLPLTYNEKSENLTFIAISLQIF